MLQAPTYIFLITANIMAPTKPRSKSSLLSLSLSLLFFFLMLISLSHSHWLLFTILLPHPSLFLSLVHPFPPLCFPSFSCLFPPLFLLLTDSVVHYFTLSTHHSHSLHPSLSFFHSLCSWGGMCMFSPIHSLRFYCNGVRLCSVLRTNNKKRNKANIELIEFNRKQLAKSRDVLCKCFNKKHSFVLLS